MFISVVIPTFNRADVLRRMLNLLSLQNYPLSQFEVIIVDDGSSDDTVRVLEEWKSKAILDLQYVSQANAGQGVARNRGIELAKGDIILLLGDDMLPRSGVISAHARFHIHNPEIESVGLGKAIWHPELQQNSYMRFLDRGIQFDMRKMRKGATLDFRHFYTNNISFKRAFLGDLRFDADFRGWGLEDTELGYRLQKKGMRLQYIEGCIVEHLHEMHESDLEKRMFSMGKNSVLFAQKHPEAAHVFIPRGVKRALIMLACLVPVTLRTRALRYRMAGIRAGKAQYHVE